jgi:hypothetical protein
MNARALCFRTSLFSSLILCLFQVGALGQSFAGAVAHWPFDDQMNPTADLVGGHNGALIGTASFNCIDHYPHSSSGCAVQLFGGSDLVQVADDPALSFGPSSPMSVALWFKHETSQTGVHILSKRQGCVGPLDTINYQLAWDPVSANGLQFASGGGIVETGVPIQLGAWMHMAVTYDGAGTLLIYVNGEQVAQALSYSLSGMNNDPLRIGAGGSCGGNFQGLIDEVWIFNRALSPQEIGVLAATNPASYCIAKTNSLGCTPTIGSTGVPSMSGANNFFVTASSVRNNKTGILLWGGSSASTPFFGGTLCIAAPIVRTPTQASGGTQGPDDCSGGYSFHFTQAYLASQFLSAGSTVYAQYWSRDPGFSPPNNIGLTDALRFTVCP